MKLTEQRRAEMRKGEEMLRDLVAPRHEDDRQQTKDAPISPSKERDDER